MIITAYPVRGLDINSSYTIYNILNRQKEKGVGILFVGEDLDVMLELCDKILVLCHGKVTGLVNAKEADKEYLGLLMTDALAETAATGESTPGIMDTIDVKVDFNKRREMEVKDKSASKMLSPFPIHISSQDDLSTKQSILLCGSNHGHHNGGMLVAAMGVNPFSCYKTHELWMLRK